MKSLFHNPYHYSASVMAKLMTVIGTTLWSVATLLRDPSPEVCALPMYRFATAWVDEDVWASITLVFCAISLIRLVRHSPPKWYGGVVYFWFMCFWIYIAIAALFSYQSYDFSGARVVVALLACYAFVTNPKRPDAGPPP